MFYKLKELYEYKHPESINKTLKIFDVRLASTSIKVVFSHNEKPTGVFTLKFIQTNQLSNISLKDYSVQNLKPVFLEILKEAWVETLKHKEPDTFWFNHYAVLKLLENSSKILNEFKHYFPECYL